MSTADVSSSPAPEAVDQIAAASSKKRKTDVEEIEVDLSLPEPPSKKAKRMLKKGKALPVKKDSDAEDGDDGLPPSKITGKDGKEKKRSEHGIWVGNLAFTVTRADLFKWIVESSGGAIAEENITRVNLPTSKAAAGDRRTRVGDADKDKPQNKGFAYVDFDTESAAIAAMALTETELNGRKVLIKNSKSFEGRPQKEAGDAAASGKADGAAPNGAPAKKAIPSRKIYVGNLSFQVTEDDLRHQFDKCGEIEWVKVATFEDSGKCKGYGWVKFKEAESAESAVKGFCKIKEEIETEADFVEPNDDSDDDDDEEEETKKKAAKPEKKFKMRKWWVNRLKGRELKIAYAEDDQTRYKKRFGKDASARPQRTRENAQGAGGEGRTRDPAPVKPAYGETAVATYLTGSMVKSEGKKTTFD